LEALRLFTIGFTRKSAETFFTLLSDAGVKRVIDVRLNNVSQLAGFARRDDLRYFLKATCGIDYLHMPELAPTHEILDASGRARRAGHATKGNSCSFWTGGKSKQGSPATSCTTDASSAASSPPSVGIGALWPNTCWPNGTASTSLTWCEPGLADEPGSSIRFGRPLWLSWAGG